MNIILIGFMGAGKTSIAKLLAKKLEFDFMEMDDLILEKSGRKTINEIFDKDGESAFRELEILVANELKDRQNAVISTGGGVVMNELNIDYLKTNGIIVYLKTQFKTAKERTGNKKDRPLFRDPEKAKELYELRLPLYEQYAKVTVETDNKPLEEIAEEVIKSIEKLPSPLRRRSG